MTFFFQSLPLELGIFVFLGSIDIAFFKDSANDLKQLSMMWWLFLYRWEESVVETLNWPWAESNSGGNARLLLGFLLVMIPSALWIESTNFHISNDYSWTPYLVIGILITVSIGNILLGLLAWSAYQQEIDSAILAVIGAGMLALQVIINDAIWWTIKFPW